MKKTSEQWQQDSDYIVLDPDGWDRKNFDFSWNELITWEEFNRRMALSTVAKKPN
jgi:hypothetical protein